MPEKEKLLKIFQECDFEELVSENFYDKVVQRMNTKEPFTWKHGISKGVIIFNNFDFVIKIPFSGYCNPPYSDSFSSSYSSSGTPEDYGENEFIRFDGADDEADHNDYCLSEVVRYKKAKLLFPTVTPLLAETALIGKVNGYPIYWQPRCETLFDSESEHKRKISEKMTNEIEFVFQERDIWLNYNWAADVIDRYDIQVFSKLCQYINMAQIGDLHSENLGYRNGAPIILDYSDFYD